MSGIINEGDEFYIMQNDQKVKLEIPPEGLLGIVAYGDLGLRAWRNAKKKVYDQKMKEQQSENSNGREKK